MTGPALFRGRYYDGQTSRSTEVEVRFLHSGEIVVRGGDLSLALDASNVEISSRLGRTPRMLRLPRGASVELPDSDELERWASRLRGRGAPRFVALLERRWPAVLLAGAIAIGFLAASVQAGIPRLASYVARALPPEVDARLGDGALEGLDAKLLQPSDLPDIRAAALQRRFEALQTAARIEPAPRLIFRDGGRIGANALALPSGIVIVTDQLVALAASDDEVVAVLAHELGHVHHRHALRSVLQDAGVALLVAGALGDFVSISSLAATIPTALVQLKYSRRFETEADAYAVSLLSRTGLSSEPLVAILRRLDERAARGTGVVGYLSTHPATDERIRAIAAGDL